MILLYKYINIWQLIMKILNIDNFVNELKSDTLYRAAEKQREVLDNDDYIMSHTDEYLAKAEARIQKFYDEAEKRKQVENAEELKRKAHDELKAKYASRRADILARQHTEEIGITYEQLIEKLDKDMDECGGYILRAIYDYVKYNIEENFDIGSTLSITDEDDCMDIVYEAFDNENIGYKSKYGIEYEVSDVDYETVSYTIKEGTYKIDNLTIEMHDDNTCDIIDANGETLEKDVNIYELTSYNWVNYEDWSDFQKECVRKNLAEFIKENKLKYMITYDYDHNLKSGFPGAELVTFTRNGNDFPFVCLSSKKKPLVDAFDDLKYDSYFCNYAGYDYGIGIGKDEIRGWVEPVNIDEITDDIMENFNIEIE